MKIFNKLFGVLLLTLTFYWVFFLGFDSAMGDAKESIYDGIMLVLWASFLIFWHVMALREQKSDLEFEQSKKDLDKATKRLLDEILGDKHKDHKHQIVKVGNAENAVHEELSEILVDIIDEVTNHGTPDTKHFAEIKKRFEAKTGHEVHISKEGLGLNVKIGKEPIAKKAPARKPATKAPVKKPAAPTKKTVTKKGK